MSATAGTPQAQSGSSAGHIRIRGTRDGIGVSLPDDLDTHTLIAELRTTIDARGDFLQGARVILDYAARLPTVGEVDAIESVLRESGIGLRSISVSRPEHGAILREMGYGQVHVVAPASQRERDFRRPISTVRGNDQRPQALYLKRTLRSGASIEHDGDIVIIGDVNPGAHVSAGGDVIVWGSLRGTVQAGAGDSGIDETAIICALRLEPTQLRIGSHVARPPDGNGWAVDGPQSALISAEDNQIVVEPWRGSGASSSTERRGR